jgi:hypothetical protein
MRSDVDEESLVRELRDATVQLEIPLLRDDALERIVSRRARGERIVLRTADSGFARRVRSTHFALAAVAGMAALIVAAVIVQRDAAVQSDDIPNHVALAAVDSACASAPSTTRDSSALRHLMISAFGVPAACGAEPRRDAPIAYKPSQIKTGTFTYSSKSITDGVFTSTHPSSAITLSRTTWKGTPAILAVRDGPLITGVHLDSLIVSADGPAPLYFVSIYKTQRPPGSIRAEFDSASFTVTTTGHLDTAATLPFHLKSGQLPFGFTWPLVIPALPLAAGWHGVLDVVPPIHPRAYKYFLRPWETISLRVVKRERIRVAAGVFDCWKVQLGEAEAESAVWVSTETHLVIRSVSVGKSAGTTFEDEHELESADFDTAAPNS